MATGGSCVRIAAVEGGGTSFVVAVAEIPAAHAEASPSSFKSPSILHRLEVDSSHDSPQGTLRECTDFFRLHKPSDGYNALGIAMFGPVGLNPSRPNTYGRILPTTPKQAWRNVDFLTPLVEACSGGDRHKLIVKVDTDVNAPAVAEYMAASKDNNECDGNKISSVAYVTVGTGVGVGLVIHGQPVHGRMHPEGGHVPIQPLEYLGYGGEANISEPSFTGYSWGDKTPFQGRHTVESMASSVALTERLNFQAKALHINLGEGGVKKGESSAMERNVLSEIKDDSHEIWHHAANAVACLCVTLILTTSIEKIVLGGGIMRRKGLVEKIRKRTVDLMNGYVELPPLQSEEMAQFITTSSFGTDIGLLGAVVLAQRAYYEAEMAAPPMANKTNTTTAFYVGVIHGVVVGAAVACLGFFMWATKGKASRR